MCAALAVACVGFDWVSAIELSATRIVGSTHLA
eukprot:CAMPEP_0168738166 /NCGR_PEP_ID=MMETSP0724-20121128/10786_1 /TAXON_ID=265536 /ORGANISM="Amphiprora sp., Strain CCMP467" /LENGTH=32 /DNA_ID= /DNA_START= /DNA_END= /DNA_ORIENTATION=